MVTYEQLFDTLRREKSRDELQVLPRGFYAEAAAFLAEKRQAAADQGLLSSQKAGIEFQNASRILRELYDRRERKVLTLAMHKTRTESAIIDREALLEEEQELFDAVVSTLQQARHAILVKGGRPAPSVHQEPPAVPEIVKVRFSAAVPKFVGKDLSVYGPFEEGQEAALPANIARILIDKGRASMS